MQSFKLNDAMYPMDFVSDKLNWLPSCRGSVISSNLSPFFIPKSIISDPQRIEKEIGWKTTKNIEYIINVFKKFW